MSDRLQKLKEEIYRYTSATSLPKGRVAGKYLFVEGNYDYQWGSFIVNKKNIYNRVGRIESFEEIVFDTCLEYSVISKDDFKNLKIQFVNSLVGRIYGASDNTISIYNHKFFTNFNIT